MFILVDASNSPHHLCLLVYRIPCGFTPILKKHGVEKPFHPTWPSTKQQIKKMCIDYGPAETVCSITTEAGGIVQATAPGQLPRDEKQVTNFKKRFHSSLSYPMLLQLQIAYLV